MKAREPRTNVVLPARIRWDGRWVTATVRNVSAHGMLLCASDVPASGTYVEIQLASGVVTARTVWSREQFFGLRSRDVIDVQAMLSSRANAGAQARMVAANASFGKSAPAHAAPAVQIDRSQAQSRSFQYLVVLAIGAAAASSLGWEVYRTLSAPFSAVQESLSAHSGQESSQ